MGGSGVVNDDIDLSALDEAMQDDDVAADNIDMDDMKDALSEGGDAAPSQKAAEETKQSP